MNKFLIYALADPETKEVRYIGRSSSGLKRPKSHWQDPALRVRRDYCHNWVRSILSMGMTPEVLVLHDWDITDNTALNEAEIAFIAHFRSRGARLTNLTAGGEGASGCVRSAEMRARLSRVRTGVKRGPHSVEHKAALSAVHKGRQPSPQCKEKARLARSRSIIRSDGVQFSSVRAAARALAVTHGAVVAVLKGRMTRVKGYGFRYE